MGWSLECYNTMLFKKRKTTERETKMHAYKNEQKEIKRRGK